MKTADFPRLLAAFFTDRLMQQRQASRTPSPATGTRFDCWSAMPGRC